MSIDFIAALPIEPGLYQVVDGETPIHHEVTFRLMEDGVWVDMYNNDHVAPSRLSILGAHAMHGRLVRLVREEPSRLVEASAEQEPSPEEELDRAMQIVGDLGMLRCVQSEMTDRYPAVSFTGMDSTLWAAAQDRIEALQAELEDLW